MGCEFNFWGAKAFCYLVFETRLCGQQRRPLLTGFIEFESPGLAGGASSRDLFRCQMGDFRLVFRDDVA